jgi:hypothetical protein
MAQFGLPRTPFRRTVIIMSICPHRRRAFRAMHVEITFMRLRHTGRTETALKLRPTIKTLAVNTLAAHIII